MRYCEKCGNEIMDEAVICPGCGCAVMNENSLVQTEVTKSPKTKRKVKKIWIILAAVVLLLGAVAAILFLPRDLKLDDIQQTNVVTAIIRYGLPKKISSNEDGVYLTYEDKVDFYGITPFSFAVYPDENKVVFFFSDDVEAKVYDKIDRYCDFEKNLSNIFHKFSYDNLYITTYDYDGSYINIEIE